MANGDKSQSINRGKEKKKKTSFSFSANKCKFHFKPSVEWGGRNLFIEFLDLWLSCRYIQQAKAVILGTNELALCRHLSVLAESQSHLLSGFRGQFTQLSALLSCCKASLSLVFSWLTLWLSCMFLGHPEHKKFDKVV